MPDITIKVVGHDHPLVADTNKNIGVVHWNLADYEKALFHYGKAQEVFVALYGYEHLNVASTYCNMANVFEEQGQYEKALEYYQKDLEITSKVVGQDHPRIADTKRRIAVLVARKIDSKVECGSGDVQFGTGD